MEEQFTKNIVSLLTEQHLRNKELWAELADRLDIEWQNEKGCSKEIPELFQLILDKYEIKK